MIATLAFWLGSIAFGLALVARFARRDARLRRSLDERLERGELDADEYRARRALLGS